MDQFINQQNENYERPEEWDKTGESATPDESRILSREVNPEDHREGSLRPRALNEFIGQHKLIRNLNIFIEAAKKRDESLEHLLIHGPPGLGKTTLANIVANEMNVNIKTTSGPAIERPGDLAAILTNLEKGDVLFIDEIHRLNRSVEEVLYPAMEDYELDIVIGKGPSARSIRLTLERFTLIGATTRIGMLSAPLRDRFGALERMEFYDPSALKEIVTRAASLLETHITDSAAMEVAKRSRGTPRIANRILKRVRDWAQVQGDGRITDTIVAEGLSALGIDSLGLDDVDRKCLRAIIEKFNGGPVGIDTISASISEESDTIEDVYEPYLLQLGFIDRTPKGRLATRLAYEHLGLSMPERSDGTVPQQELF
ncbi:MAG: Holliday junction branch migration DNA helicase RuvB [bacterium]|nr:Holliday junction branch migration DNA helicase RuvB [bacterium]